MPLLPLQVDRTYITNMGETITLETKGRGPEYNHLHSPELSLWFSKKTGIAPGTGHKITGHAPAQEQALTLPPVVGKKYIFEVVETRETYECVITAESDYEGARTWLSESESGYYWTFWDDGEAKIDVGGDDEDFAAFLVRDVPVSAIEELHTKRDAMMKRLKELGAC